MADYIETLLSPTFSHTDQKRAVFVTRDTMSEHNDFSAFGISRMESEI
jgi:hypothetical protein